MGGIMLRGSMVAMVTPMAADGVVDDRALARLVDFHVTNNTDAIVAVGTTGESATLDHSEHVDVIARIIELVNGRMPVIAGTGANSTREAVHLTQAAEAVGADACLLVTPYYNRPTQEGLYLHFKSVAEAVSLPLILYNVPSRTACDMLPDTVVRLAEIDNISGIKEATGKIGRVSELVSRCPKNFAVYSGEDWLSMETMLAGGKGVISVTANVAPHLMHKMCAKALSGDRVGAENLDLLLQPLHEALFLESNPIPVKWLLKDMGLIGDGIRLPLTQLSNDFHDQLRDALEQAQLVSP